MSHGAMSQHGSTSQHASQQHGSTSQHASQQHGSTSAQTDMPPVSVPRINIGVLGHVSHGKSTLVRALTHKDTAQHSDERAQNCTIKLGYADAAVYKSDSSARHWTLPGDGAPATSVCPLSGEQGTLVRVASFVDCPGHAQYMATMLSGTAAMDAVLLVVSATDKFPQPQALEHLRVARAAGLGGRLAVVQNKVDVAGAHGSAEQAVEIHRLIPEAAILPCCATRGAAACTAIAGHIAALPLPERPAGAAPVLQVVRSFNVKGNAAAAPAGVVGGAVLSGEFREGTEVELRPGVQQEDGECVVVRGRVKAVFRGKDRVSAAGPGGLVGVEVEGLPAEAARADGLVGQVLGLAGSLPAAALQIQLRDLRLCSSLPPPPVGGTCAVLCGTRLVEAVVTEAAADGVTLALASPVCVLGGDLLPVLTAGQSVRLIGCGVAAAADGTPALLRPTVAQLLSLPFAQVWDSFPRLHERVRERRLRKHWKEAPEEMQALLQMLRSDGVFDVAATPSEVAAAHQSTTAPSAGSRKDKGRAGAKAATDTVAVNPAKVAEAGYRYQMPAVTGSLESRLNGSRTALTNIEAVAQAIRRPVSVLVKSMSAELGVAAKWKGERQAWLLTGHHHQRSLQQCVYGFIKKLVLCRECADPRTDLESDGKSVTMRCTACGHVGPADCSRKVATALKPTGSERLSAAEDRAAAEREAECEAEEPWKPVLGTWAVRRVDKGVWRAETHDAPKDEPAPVSPTAAATATTTSAAADRSASSSEDEDTTHRRSRIVRRCKLRAAADSDSDVPEAAAPAVAAVRQMSGCVSEPASPCASAAGSGSEGEVVCRRMRKVRRRKPRRVDDSESEATSQAPVAEAESEAAPPAPVAPAPVGLATDHWLPTYSEQLHDVLLRDSCSAPEGGLLHLPRPAVSLPPRQKHTFVTNFSSLAKALGRKEEALRAYVESTLQAKVRINENGCARIDKPFRQTRVSAQIVFQTVAAFARDFVQCRQCRQGNTVQEPGRRLVCRVCGATRCLGTGPDSWQMEEGEARKRQRMQRASRYRHGHTKPAADSGDDSAE